MSYDYKEALREAIKDFIKEYRQYDKPMDYDYIYDELWIEDSVTGNGSDSYTFNRSIAKEYVIENLDLAALAFGEFDDLHGLGYSLYTGDYEKIDVTIRCYLLSTVLQEVLDEMDI